MAFLGRTHPLGAGLKSASLCFGVFWEGRCEGVLTFGNPIVNNAAKCFGYEQHDVLELRKMWLSDKLPRNSESRAMSVCGRLIRQHYPAIKMLITYCDAEEKAAAYRGSGWIGMQSSRSMREVLVGGQWLTLRAANRKGITNQRTDCKFESRRKWALPLCEAAAQKLRTFCAGSTSAVRSPFQAGGGGSTPTPALATGKITSKRLNLPDTPKAVTGRRSVKCQQ